MQTSLHREARPPIITRTIRMVRMARTIRMARMAKTIKTVRTIRTVRMVKTVRTVRMVKAVRMARADRLPPETDRTETVRVVVIIPEARTVQNGHLPETER